MNEPRWLQEKERIDHLRGLYKALLEGGRLTEIEEYFPNCYRVKVESQDYYSSNIHENGEPISFSSITHFYLRPSKTDE